MSKEVGVIVLGVVVAIAPFIGLPGDWRTTLLVLVGLGIVALGFLLRSEALTRSGVHSSNFFVDNRSHTPAQPQSEMHHEDAPVRVQ